MRPEEMTSDSIRSWRYAVAALRAQHIAKEQGRTLTPAELVEAADRLIAEE